MADATPLLLDIAVPSLNHLGLCALVTIYRQEDAYVYTDICVLDKSRVPADHPVVSFIDLPTGFIADTIACSAIEDDVIASFENACMKFSHVSRTLDDKWFSFVNKVSTNVQHACNSFIGRPVLRLKKAKVDDFDVEIEAEDASSENIEISRVTADKVTSSTARISFDCFHNPKLPIEVLVETFNFDAQVYPPKLVVVDMIQVKPHQREVVIQGLESSKWYRVLVSGFNCGHGGKAAEFITTMK